MHRKTFLRMAALGMLALPFSPTQAMRGKGRNTSLSSRKVIIIGAGMAGAAAARTLADAGYEVLVLEARDRIGGRIHTFNDWGYPLELGANWIHDARMPGNPLQEFANRWDIQNQKTHYGRLAAFDRNGQTIGGLSLALFYQRFEKTLRAHAEGVLSQPADQSIGQVIRDVVRERTLNRPYSPKQEDILSLIEQSYTNNLAVSTDQASAQYYFRHWERRQTDDYLVTGGYVRMVEQLFSGIALRTHSTVTQINTLQNQVEVVTENGSFQADHVIVTVPISLLQQQRIQFNPALPEWKTRSFQRMQMGVFNKVVMEFSQKFWKSNADFQCYTTQLKNADVIMLNYHHYTGRPVLVAMPVDQSGLWVEANDPRAIQSQYQELFHKAFPHREIEFKRTHITRWASDPFSLGAYSHVPVGTQTADLDALRSQVGRIYFAGEATSVNNHSTVHGAYDSGVREAMKILAL